MIFDALTLPISTGQEDYRTAGIETLKAVEGDQDGAARGEDDPGCQQYFVRAECLFAAGAESASSCTRRSIMGSTWPS